MTFPWPFIPAAIVASGGDATITFTDNDQQSAPGTSYTFTSQSFGSASSDRLILVGVATEDNGAADADIVSMTVGGISASLIVAAKNTTEHAEFWIAAVPSGTSGTIAITFAASAFEVGIGVWALYNASSTATNTGSDISGDPSSINLNINAGGVAAGVLCQRSNVNVTYTWVNLTKTYDNAITPNSDYTSGASAAFASAQVGLTITAASSGGAIRDPVTVLASFPKL